MSQACSSEYATKQRAACEKPLSNLILKPLFENKSSNLSSTHSSYRGAQVIIFPTHSGKNIVECFDKYGIGGLFMQDILRHVKAIRWIVRPEKKDQFRSNAKRGKNQLEIWQTKLGCFLAGQYGTEMI